MGSAKFDIPALQDVVWERLDSVDGDTEYLMGNFASYRDKAFRDEVRRAAKLTQAAFSDILPPPPSAGTSHAQQPVRISAASGKHLGDAVLDI